MEHTRNTPQHVNGATQRRLEADALIKPMKVIDLADIWGFNRRKMLVVLRAMQDAGEAIQHGHHWQIPLQKMPHTWLIKQGLLSVQVHE